MGRNQVLPLEGRRWGRPQIETHTLVVPPGQRNRSPLELYERIHSRDRNQVRRMLSGLLAPGR